ncbi:putative disease resistance protein RGA3 [Rosa rugosa]|uniref:putative disease resistance protein RGA3 n=1 Tax=Rosa rugosa TaxID=74645 RepID=UPI002B406375|nr:putative disease resistance protein RGA3 [Rosa rugosa]
MTESLVSFAARELLKKVVALLADEEFSLVCRFKNELAMMHTTLVKLQAMLQAAEHLTQDQRDDVKIWVKKIEEIAGDVDDLLDDFGYEVLWCKVELQDQMKNKVLSIFVPIVFRHKMGRRFKNINESLVNLENQAASFQLVIAGNATCDDPEVDRQTAFCCDEDEKNIIGRGEVVSDMVTTLINSNTTQENLLTVLAIVGMAGLGKTTVAKSVYNDSEIGRYFQQKIWMKIRVERQGCNTHWPPKKSGTLEGKRYLLVLDDVWNEDLQKWDDLRTSLLSIRGTEGSSIIVTTRKVKVAKIMETLPRYDLTKLSDDDCWLLLKNKAVSTRSTLPQDEERIGKAIANKCGGVPLVAKNLLSFA